MSCFPLSQQQRQAALVIEQEAVEQSALAARSRASVDSCDDETELMHRRQLWHLLVVIELVAAAASIVANSVS